MASVPYWVSCHTAWLETGSLNLKQLGGEEELGENHKINFILAGHVLFHVDLGHLSNVVYERGDHGKCYGGSNFASRCGIKYLQAKYVKGKRRNTEIR